MDFVANQRYSAVRKQLDSLHYCQPFNIESSALVERLLNDLMKTTEAYQKTKNEFAVVQHENKLNQQSLLPFQKENERLVKENNSLHLDIIKAKEDLGQVEIKWKSSMRQLQNECQDLKFLVDQKDLRIKKQDGELTKLKSKMEKILTKTFMPSQNEIIDGLGETEFREHNILKGTSQDFEITHPLQKHHNDMSEVMKDQSFTYERQVNREENDRKNKEWADEVRKADERSDQFRQETDSLRKRKLEIEERLQQTEKQVYVREEEIKRLQQLYEGGQNLDKMNMRFIQDTNEKTVVKLQNQVEFLNKENHKLQQQVDILRGDQTVIDEIGQLKSEIQDLTFENQTLRKDLSECTKLLKDYQEKEFQDRTKDSYRQEENKQSYSSLEAQYKDLLTDYEKLKSEHERVHSLRSAYNADKNAFGDKISELERKLVEKDQEISEVQHRLKLSEVTVTQFKNEVNFWNGKCTTLKRDLEYQERYMDKFKQENLNLSDENDLLKRQLDLKDREQFLLNKQVNGLHEDNERINRLYQVVEREAFAGKPVIENKIPQAKQYNSKESQAPKGDQKWKTVDDEFGGTGTFGKNDFQGKVVDDMKTTVKRSNYI